MGGNHLVPLPILRAGAKERPVGLIQIDSHSDTFEDFMGTKCHHATSVRRDVEKGLLDPQRIIQIGLRGIRYDDDDDIAYGAEHGIRMVTMDELEKIGREAVIAEIKRVVGNEPTYIAIDIIGGDICEVVPSLDPTGITCINAANLMFELACLVAAPRKR